MVAVLALLTVFAQSSQSESNPDKGNATLIIILTLVVAVIVIGAVATFFAKRGSKVPPNEPHDKGHVGS